MITLEPNSGTPLYLQLHDAIVADIVAGYLPPGTKLGSVRKVAADFGINPATVKQAYDLLQEEGVVVTKRRSGTIVASRCPAAPSPLEKTVSLMLSQGYTFMDIRSELDQLEEKLCPST